LTLEWAVIGYFSLFDFGLGRALTQALAQNRATQSTEAQASIASAALRLMTALGLAGGIIAFVASGAIVRHLSVSPSLTPEAIAGFRVLALGIPMVIVATGYRGILEAYERFDLVNVVRVPLGASTFLFPLVTLVWTRHLAASVAAMVVARAVALIVYGAMSKRILPHDTSAGHGIDTMRPLLRSGAWMTVSNVISPLISSADRFLIAALASASVVAFYTAPYEVISKLTALIGFALAAALFPAFAARAEQETPLYSHATSLAAAAFLPVAIVLIAAAPEALSLWLGADFAARSEAVLRILALGLFANGIAQVPFAYLQAIGRADVTAKLHIMEAPLYFALAIPLMRAYGVRGAAIAWSVRVAVDTAALLACAAWFQRERGIRTERRVWVFLGTTGAVVVAQFLLAGQSLPVRLGFALVAVAVVAAYAWVGLVTPQERRSILSLFRAPTAA
jgi:O-antigen/teichoic acid export membrane protein